MTLAARTESPRVLEPGARIGKKLEVLRPLGEGGMGTLWVARNLTTEAEVAIKVLRPQRAEDADLHAAERFRHEARLGAMLAHRNITRVFDLLEDDDGSLVLVMELLQGETLQAALETKGPVSCKDAVALIVPILGALQHAHEHGVVHRDLKPSNIFLHVDPDGHTTPKLLDFGIAKMADSSVKTQAGSALGTPSYMSPEQVRASDKLDGRSDLFSVGSVLYEIITGENPFRTDSPSATLARVLELEVDPDPRIEPRVWLVIQRALAKQPYERHASAGDLADALCDAVGDALPKSLRRDKARPRGSDPKLDVRPPVVAEPAEKDVADTVEMSSAAVAPRPRRRGTMLVYGAAVVLAIAGVVLFRLASPSKPVPSPSAIASGATPASALPPIAPSEEPSAVMEVGEVDPAAPNTHRVPRLGGNRPPGKRPSPSAKPPPSASTPSVARTPGF